jgi:hypothetical protein
MEKIKDLFLALCIISVISISGCAGTPKYLPPEIPVQFSKIYVEPFKNMSTIELADGFPKDSTRLYILIGEIEKAHHDFVRTLSLYGKKGNYTVVKPEEFPTIIITPTLMPYTLDSLKLNLPVFIKIVNKEKNESYKKEFSVEAVYPDARITKNTYHFWGVMLASWRRNFPSEEIAKLFYSQRAD